MLHHSRYTLNLYHSHIYVYHLGNNNSTNKLNHVVLHVVQTTNHFPYYRHYKYIHVHL